MKTLIKQSEDLLRDISDHGVSSIEKNKKIDRLVTKLEEVESEESIINKIQDIIKREGSDVEAVNADSEKIIYALLNQLGYSNLVSILEAIPAW